MEHPDREGLLLDRHDPLGVIQEVHRIKPRACLERLTRRLGIIIRGPRVADVVQVDAVNIVGQEIGQDREQVRVHLRVGGGEEVLLEAAAVKGQGQPLRPRRLSGAFVVNAAPRLHLDARRVSRAQEVGQRIKGAGRPHLAAEMRCLEERAPVRHHAGQDLINPRALTPGEHGIRRRSGAEPARVRPQGPGLERKGFAGRCASQPGQQQNEDYE